MEYANWLMSIALNSENSHVTLNNEYLKHEIEFLLYIHEVSLIKLTDIAIFHTWVWVSLIFSYGWGEGRS